jgi:hypothetical protein
VSAATGSGYRSEQPPKFELVITLKATTALAITIPQSLWLRADEVIQQRSLRCCALR